jgi:hypothetical protein
MKQASFQRGISVLLAALMFTVWTAPPAVSHAHARGDRPHRHDHRHGHDAHSHEGEEYHGSGDHTQTSVNWRAGVAASPFFAG